MSPHRRLSPARRRVVHALLVGVAVSVAVTALSRVGVLSGWETRAVDAFVFLRDRVPAPEIVLVEIDEESFAALGERQPLSRRYLADLGDFLLRLGARVVAFDVLLKSRSIPEEDEALVAMTRRREAPASGRLVFASVAIPRKGEGPPRYDPSPPFSPELGGFFAFPNAPVGADGVIRRMTPVLPAGDGGLLPSLPLAVLAAYAGHTPADLSRLLKGERGGSLALPVRDPGRGITRNEPVSLSTLSGTAWRIDFAGSQGAFTSFPSAALVQMARSGVRPESDNPFSGKIVLVGATFQESRDFYPTPVGLLSGVEIHANMVHTLLSRRALLPPHWLLNLSVLIGACLSVSLLSLWLRPLWVALASLALLLGFIAVSYEAYTQGGYWLDFVAPLVGMVSYIEGSRLIARRRLRAAFGQYVSPEVMDRVLREGAGLGGEVRTVSVLMSDLRGFTTLSERLLPDRISEMMNEYFTAMVEVITSHRGMVQDFIGDGILALYGAPVDDPDHAWHAVATALDMQAALQQLNRRWQVEGRPPLAMGVAVHTGDAFVGNVGSPRKKKYAALGDTVNTVSRIEGLNRELGTGILISGATLRVVKERVVVQDRGAIPLKGRTQPVEVFELLGASGPGTSGR
ncbi:MAG: adenylate/guanylate cyclase domain-containing protein [Candidatus Rokubacteria bacterium]|nr:adenylate/guanylate cyclase domain-containing protein [Candidatus Rokubacteria bacterium]